jgi:putative membrane-bound dehydrogenase-like protein
VDFLLARQNCAVKQFPLVIMPFFRFWRLPILFASLAGELPAADPNAPLSPPDWSVEIVVAHPQIRYPSAIACAPDGRLFIAEDPIDMDGPRDQPIDRVVCRHPDGRITEFATNLHCVFGLLYLDGKLYVNHAPKLSVFEDGGDAGKNRQDWFDYVSPRANGMLLTGSGSHIPANLRWGMDGFIYMAVGDAGLFGMTDRSGKKFEMQGGGLARFRPDGTAMEIFANGTRNHPDVAINAEDECFTYDNTDDGLGWWTRVTHLVDRGFYGYPWDYKPRRPYTLWMMLDYGSGSGTCALAYNEDALPPEYHGNIFFGEFARQQLLRLKLKPDGASYTVGERVQVGGRDFLTSGATEFRPTGIAMAPDGASFYIADWNSNFAGVAAPIGRVLKVSYTGRLQGQPRPPWWVAAATGKPFQADVKTLAEGLKHPAQSVRLVAQRRLAERKDDVLPAVLPLLTNRTENFNTRAAALWTLDMFDGGKSARTPILSLLNDADPALRSQVARQLGTRAVVEASGALTTRLKDPDAKVRFHTATALGRIADPAAIPELIGALAGTDLFARYAAFTALNQIGRRHPEQWNQIVANLKSPNPRLREGVVFAVRETWDAALIQSLTEALKSGGLDPATRVALLEMIADVARQEPPWDGSWWGSAGNPAARARPARTRDWPSTPTALTALREALRDKESAVRVAALGAIRRLKETNAVPILRELLVTETAPSQSKELLLTLADIGGPGFAEELKQLVDSAVQGKATARLDALLPAALAAVDDAAGFGHVVRLAQSSARADWRASAVQALGRIRDPAAAPVLTSLLNDQQLTVACAAVEALPKIALPPLQREAARLLKDPRVELRRSLVRALAASPDPTALESLNEGLNDPVIRDDIVKAFAARPDISGFNAYLAGLNSKDSATVDAAVNALLVVQGEAWPRLETAQLLQSVPMPVLQRLANGSRNHPFNQMFLLGPLEDGPHDSNELIQAAAANRPYGGASWQQAQAKPLTGRVPVRELLKLARPDPRKIAFALLPINVPTAQQMILSIEANDLRGANLNGNDVLSTAFAAENGPRRFREFATTLLSGQNLLLVTIGLGDTTPLLSLSWTLNAPLPRAENSSPEAYARFAQINAGAEKNGEAAFHNSRKAACARCHRVGGLGGSLGPALDGIGTKLGRAQMIEAVLYPSKQILHGFHQITVARRNGESATGLLLKDDPESVVVVDSAGVTNVIKPAEISGRTISEVSLMPEGLHGGFTPQEFSDLISYLQGLK